MPYILNYNIPRDPSQKHVSYYNNYTCQKLMDYDTPSGLCYL